MQDASTETVFRGEVYAEDVAAVDMIVRSTGFFNDEEIAVAAELVTERWEKGPDSGYHFIFVDVEEKAVGYACYGPIPATASSYDLYWIAVHESQRGKGLGRILLEKCEHAAARLGCTRLYAETSSREQYAPTRTFYEKNDYRLEALLEDFYAPSDGKCIYVKAF